MGGWGWVEREERGEGGIKGGREADNHEERKGRGKGAREGERQPGREVCNLPLTACVCRYEQYLQFAREMGLGSLISISMVDLGDAYLTTITVGTGAHRRW